MIYLQDDKKKFSEANTNKLQMSWCVTTPFEEHVDED